MSLELTNYFERRSAVSGREHVFALFWLCFARWKLLRIGLLIFAVCCVQSYCRPISRCLAGCSRLLSAQLLLVDSRCVSLSPRSFSTAAVPLKNSCFAALFCTRFSFLGSSLLAAWFWTRLAHKLQVILVYVARTAETAVGGQLLSPARYWAVPAMTSSSFF